MEPLAKVIEGLIKVPGFRERLKAFSVLADWEEIVGKEVASRTRPVAFSRGRLKLAVRDPVWASALRFEAERILSRLNERAGERLFREIRFVVEPFPGEKTSRRAKKELSPEEEARLKAAVSAIEDPELREAFLAWRRVLAMRR